MIVLIGFMGAGKSTVGTALAARLGQPFVDTDSLIEEREGRPIAELFAAEGEGHFRALERDVVLEVLADGSGIAALGGGSVTHPEVRTVLAGHEVVYLSVELDEALRRLSGDATRPLLQKTDELPVLHQYRRSLYEEVATVTIATDGRSVAECADEIAGILATQRRSAAPDVDIARVDLADRGYDVVVGDGVTTRFADWLPADLEPERAFIVTHESLSAVARSIATSLGSRGIVTAIEALPEGERSKSVASATSLWDRMAGARLHRSDIVVGVGGGVITDVAGFVASTYNRGVPVVHVPTTLLAQVDAAIGGKTGVDLTAGKNLVGTFHQPAVVIDDVSLLASLPAEEMRSGLAEVIKAGFIADASLVELVERQRDAILQGDTTVLREVVVRAVSIKAEIVARDERESSVRAILNYGHTFAHAIETLHLYEGIRHGEAVAVGMMAAAYLSNELGRLSQDEVERHRQVISHVGLPVTMDLELDDLERVWALDKKYERGVRFVVLDAIGKPVTGVTAPRRALEKAIERLAR
ncbi:MAG: 3-dehydroquinate synthase [Actinomycetota bacterium]|nr:3-dehydroquinate synthase [Actinomycetota bacterium]